jgi:hypothetical protein
MTTLTLRQLNRTYLHRQHLLAASKGTALDMVQHVVALQAQVASPPYFGLAARLHKFAPPDLMALRDKQTVVRTALLRSTLHWVTAADFAWMRPLLQPALEKAWQGFFGARKSGIEVGPLCVKAREILKRGPISLTDLSTELAKEFPHWNQPAMEYGVRTHLPLVQVSPAGSWKGGTAARYRLQPIAFDPDPKRLVRRYLAAFGPASPRDIAAWAGYTAIGKTMEAMREELVEYRAESGTKLYDLPNLPIVDGRKAAPVRFVAEYDNLVLGHADRTRVLPDAVRKKVLLSAGRVMPTVLIDGFVGGTWKIERKGKQATLRIALFAAPKAPVRQQILKAAEKLVTFAEPDLPTREILLLDE